MKSIFEERVYKEVLQRIDALHENSNRQWGKMTVGQMAWHCQFPFKIGIKNKDKGKGNLFGRLFIKKSMYNDKPFRKSLPTASSLKTKETKQIAQEKEILRNLVSEFHELKTRKSWNPHPIFGKLTHEQWGKMQFKHLDHHLRQFGV